MTVSVAVLVTPNDDFGLDEQLQEAIGPFPDASSAFAWVQAHDAGLERGEFYAVLALLPPR